MASTSLTIVSEADGRNVVRFLRRNVGHVSSYSHALISFLSGVEVRVDRPADSKTFHGMGFLAASLIAHLTPNNGDTFILSPDTENAADFTFKIFERDGDIFVRCQDDGGVIFETNATKAG